MKTIKIFKKRKGEKIRKGSKKLKLEQSDNEGCDQRLVGEMKDSSKNKIGRLQNKSSSSALSNLMGMVHCKNTQLKPKSVSPKEETFNNNHCSDITESDRNIEADSDSFKESTIGINVCNEEFPASNRYHHSKDKEDKTHKSNDVMAWTELQKDTKKEFRKNDDCHNIARKSAFPGVDKSKEPNTTESKFFRFSALAKELSGR